MKNFCLGVVLLLASLSFPFSSAVYSAPPETQAKKNLEPQELVRIHGATDLFSLSAELGKLFTLRHPEVWFEIEECGTLLGLKNLLNHDCDVAAICLNIRQTPFASEASKIEQVPMGSDGLALIVHPSNPVKDISLDQLKKIYSGAITNWKELGGPDKTIIPIVRDQDSGAMHFFANQVMGATPLRKDALAEISSTAVIASVSSSPKTIGFISHIALTPSVKTLSLNGIPCSKETLSRKLYPLRRTISYCFLPNAAPSTLAFRDLVKSEKGKQLAQEYGLVEIIPESKNAAQK